MTAVPPPASGTVVAGITTRNRSAVLPKAIASLQAQQGAAVRIVVLDDGSTDATDSLRPRFPAVRWIRHEKPAGIIESRNELMRAAEGEYYLSLDDDAWFLRGDEISLAVAHLASNPSLAAVAFDILSPDRPGEEARGAARPVAMFIGCGHVIRLSAARDAGYYAPTPGIYGSEEKDLALRLADMGCRIDLLPGVHVWHDKAWAGRDHGPLHRSGVCNELVMTLRRCPMPELLAVLPLKLVSYLAFWLRHPSYLRPGLAGIADFLRHLPAGWRGRRPVRRSTFFQFSRGAP